MIGEMYYRAALLQKTQTDDGGGGYTESWTTIDTVWAAMQVKGVTESFRGDIPHACGLYRLTIRRRTDVSAGWRIKLDGRSLDVISVSDPGSMSPFMQLNCRDVS